MMMTMTATATMMTKTMMMTTIMIRTATETTMKFFANNTHRQVLLLCLHHHVNPLEQNILLARDTTINLPAVVEVDRTRDEDQQQQEDQ